MDDDDGDPGLAGTLVVGLVLVGLVLLAGACSCCCLERFFPDKSSVIITWVDSSVLKAVASNNGSLTDGSTCTSVGKVRYASEVSALSFVSRDSS